MRVDLFDFVLPPESIALRPANPREAARLMVVRPDQPEPVDHRHIADLPGLLVPGDVLVLNDTRVIPAQLEGWRRRGEAVARIHVQLHQRVDGQHWQAFIRPAKKCRLGERIHFDGTGTFFADLVEKNDEGEALLAFSCTGAALDAAIAQTGHMPIPPYIAARRGADEGDAHDYQTCYATHDGAVAAPTAGLHFTPAMLAQLAAKGVEILRVTLHVGAGTFLPVKVEDTDAHRMHAETGIVDAATASALNEARASGRRIVCVGTTSLRIVESATDEHGLVQSFHGQTRLFITPGYRFRMVDVLLTNFHLPRSTLYMLVCAFVGTPLMQGACAQAIALGYRFYSYGDACLLHRAG